MSKLKQSVSKNLVQSYMYKPHRIVPSRVVLAVMMNQGKGLHRIEVRASHPYFHSDKLEN